MLLSRAQVSHLPPTPSFTPPTAFYVSTFTGLVTYKALQTCDLVDLPVRHTGQVRLSSRLKRKTTKPRWDEACHLSFHGQWLKPYLLIPKFHIANNETLFIITLSWLIIPLCCFALICIIYYEYVLQYQNDIHLWNKFLITPSHLLCLDYLPFRTIKLFVLSYISLKRKI